MQWGEGLGLGGAGRKSGRTSKMAVTAGVLDIYPVSHEKPLEGRHDLICIFKGDVSGH